MHAAPGDPELQQRQQQDRDEEDICDCRAVARGEELKGLLEQVVDDDGGRMQRPAARRHVDLVEHLQRVDRRPYDEEERCRAEQGPDDAAKGREAPGDSGFLGSGASVSFRSGAAPRFASTPLSNCSIGRRRCACASFNNPSSR